MLSAGISLRRSISPSVRIACPRSIARETSETRVGQPRCPMLLLRCGPSIESEGTSMPSIRIIVAFATLVIAITPARAQEWPTRPDAEQIFGRIQQVRQPRPQLLRGALTFDCIWCSVNRSKRSRHSHRQRVRRSGRCQPNLARPQLSGGGFERGRSVIYRVFMNDEDFVVVYADSPEEAMLKLRDAGLEPVKAEPFDATLAGRRELPRRGSSQS